MNGEPALVMLAEDNADHAESVMPTLAEHRVANRIQHFMDGPGGFGLFFPLRALYGCGLAPVP